MNPASWLVVDYAAVESRKHKTIGFWWPNNATILNYCFILRMNHISAILTYCFCKLTNQKWRGEMKRKIIKILSIKKFVFSFGLYGGFAANGSTASSLQVSFLELNTVNGLNECRRTRQIVGFWNFLPLLLSKGLKGELWHLFVFKLLN